MTKVELVGNEVYVTREGETEPSIYNPDTPSYGAWKLRAFQHQASDMFKAEEQAPAKPSKGEAEPAKSHAGHASHKK